MADSRSKPISRSRELIRYPCVLVKSPLAIGFLFLFSKMLKSSAASSKSLKAYMKAVRKRLAKKTIAVLGEIRSCGEIRNIKGTIENRVSKYALILVNLARTSICVNMILFKCSQIYVKCFMHKHVIDYRRVALPESSSLSNNSYIE